MGFFDNMGVKVTELKIGDFRDDTAEVYNHIGKPCILTYRSAKYEFIPSLKSVNNFNHCSQCVFSHGLNCDLRAIGRHLWNESYRFCARRDVFFKPINMTM